MRIGPIVVGIIFVATGVPIALNVWDVSVRIGDRLRRHFRSGESFTARDFRQLRWMIETGGWILGLFGIVAIVVGIS